MAFVVFVLYGLALVDGVFLLWDFLSLAFTTFLWRSYRLFGKTELRGWSEACRYTRLTRSQPLRRGLWDGRRSTDPDDDADGGSPLDNKDEPPDTLSVPHLRATVPTPGETPTAV